MKRIILLLALFLRPSLGFSDALGGAGDLLGIGSGLQNMNAGAQPNNIYMPQGLGQADQAWLQQLGGMQGQVGRNVGMVDPQLLNAYQMLQGISGSGLGPAGQQAGQQYGQLGQQAQQFGGQLGQQGMDLWNLGRDPQNQLHDFMQQQVLDNSRAGTSARGIGMSADAAGLENDATRKFNMDWQNQLLGRSIDANQASGRDFTGAMALGGMAPQYTQQAAMAPIQGQAQQYGLPMDWASMFTQAQNQNVMGPQAGLQQQIMPYLGYGNQAGAAQGALNLGNQYFQNMRQQQGLGNVLGGLGGLADIFGGGGGFDLASLFGSGGSAAIGANAADALPAMAVLA